MSLRRPSRPHSGGVIVFPTEPLEIPPTLLDRLARSAFDAGRHIAIIRTPDRLEWWFPSASIRLLDQIEGLERREYEPDQEQELRGDLSSWPAPLQPSAVDVLARLELEPDDRVEYRVSARLASRRIHEKHWRKGGPSYLSPVLHPSAEIAASRPELATKLLSQLQTGSS